MNDKKLNKKLEKLDSLKFGTTAISPKENLELPRGDFNALEILLKDKREKEKEALERIFSKEK